MIVAESDSNSSSPVRRAFGAIDSGGQRRKMILAAAAAYFGQLWEDKDIRKGFYRVIEMVGEASRRRDDIAHGKVHNFTGEPPTGGFGAFLLPANYNTDRTKAYTYNDGTDPLYFTFTDYRYTSAQINEFAAKFQELSRSVAYLAGHIRKLDDGSILFARAIKGDPYLKT
jgi:hypothetical protein